LKSNFNAANQNRLQNHKTAQDHIAPPSMKSGFRMVELRCDLEATRVTRMTSANETHRKLKLGENLPSDILSIVRSGCVSSAVDLLKVHGHAAN